MREVFLDPCFSCFSMIIGAGLIGIFMFVLDKLINKGGDK